MLLGIKWDKVQISHITALDIVESAQHKFVEWKVNKCMNESIAELPLEETQEIKM